MYVSLAVFHWFSAPYKGTKVLNPYDGAGKARRRHYTSVCNVVQDGASSYSIASSNADVLGNIRHIIFRALVALNPHEPPCSPYGQRPTSAAAWQMWPHPLHTHTHTHWTDGRSTVRMRTDRIGTVVVKYIFQLIESHPVF